MQMVESQGHKDDDGSYTTVDVSDEIGFKVRIIDKRLPNGDCSWEAEVLLAGIVIWRAVHEGHTIVSAPGAAAAAFENFARELRSALGSAHAHPHLA